MIPHVTQRTSPARPAVRHSVEIILRLAPGSTFFNTDYWYARYACSRYLHRCHMTVILPHKSVHFFLSFSDSTRLQLPSQYFPFIRCTGVSLLQFLSRIIFTRSIHRRCCLLSQFSPSKARGAAKDKLVNDRVVLIAIKALSENLGKRRFRHCLAIRSVQPKVVF